MRCLTGIGLLPAVIPSAIRLHLFSSQIFGVAVPYALAQVTTDLKTTYCLRIGPASTRLMDGWPNTP